MPTSLNTSFSYSVKEFGAVGDGVADDTASIQAAIDAANNRGGALFFPRGQYRVICTLNIGPSWGFRLFGAMKGANDYEQPALATDNAASVLCWDGDATCSMIKISDAECVELNGLGLSGQLNAESNVCAVAIELYTSGFNGTGQISFVDLEIGNCTVGILCGDQNNNADVSLQNINAGGVGTVLKVLNDNGLNYYIYNLSMGGCGIGAWFVKGGCLHWYGGAASAQQTAILKVDTGGPNAGNYLLTGFRMETSPGANIVYAHPSDVCSIEVIDIEDAATGDATVPLFDLDLGVKLKASNVMAQRNPWAKVRSTDGRVTMCLLENSTITQPTIAIDHDDVSHVIVRSCYNGGNGVIPDYTTVPSSPEYSRYYNKLLSYQPSMMLRMNESKDVATVIDRGPSQIQFDPQGVVFGSSGLIPNIPDSSINFDGTSSQIQVLSAAGQLPTVTGTSTNFTLLAWVKYTTGQTNPIFGAYVPGSTGGGGILFYIHYNAVSFNSQLGFRQAHASSSGGYSYLGSTVLSANTPYFVAAVFDYSSSGSVTFYINGVADGTSSPIEPVTAFPPRTPLPPVRLYVGADENNGNNFAGNIQSFTIIKQALTATQLLELYNLGAN